MLKINEVLSFERSLFRILTILPDSVIWISLGLENAFPIEVSRTEILKGLEDGNIERAIDPHEALAFIQPEKESIQEIKRDQNYALIYPLISHELFYIPAQRGKIISEIMNQHEVTKQTIYRLARRYWQRGQTANALLPDYRNSGAKGQKRTAKDKKLGRPRIYNSEQGINVNEDIEKLFYRTIKLFFLKDNKHSLPFVYRKFQTTYKNLYPDISYSLIGCSGSGKSTTLQRILNLYPQVIYHEKFNFTQLVYLKIDCPHDGSLKNLCLHFFKAIDVALGTDFERKVALKRLGIEALLNYMRQITNTYAIGVLVIDEIQHLSVKNSGGAEKMLNFFVTLINVVGLPVVMVGTPKAKFIFDGDLRSARRGAGFGAVIWEPMKNSISSSNSTTKTEWMAFTNALWKYQWLTNKEQLSDEIRDCWFAWLYRNDKTWLLTKNKSFHALSANIPKKVDWSFRDWHMVKRLFNIFNQSLDDLSLPRQSRNWYLKQLPQHSTVEKNLYQLPLTNTFLNTFVEDISSYQIRRITRTIIQFQILNLRLAGWQILRKAGLSEERLTDEALKFLNKIKRINYG